MIEIAGIVDRPDVGMCWILVFDKMQPSDSYSNLQGIYRIVRKCIAIKLTYFHYFSSEL